MQIQGTWNGVSWKEKARGWIRPRNVVWRSAIWLHGKGFSAGFKMPNPTEMLCHWLYWAKTVVLRVWKTNITTRCIGCSFCSQIRLSPGALNRGQQNLSGKMLHACTHTPSCKNLWNFHGKLMDRPPCNAKQPVFCLHLENLEIRVRSVLAQGKSWILTASSAGSRRWSLSIICRKIELHCCGSLLNYIIFIFSILKIYHLKWFVLCNQMWSLSLSLKNQ